MKYKKVENFLQKETCSLLAAQIKVKRGVAELKNKNIQRKIARGDGQVNNAFSLPRHTITEGVLLLTNDKVNEVFDKKLVPTYSFARIYYEGAIMPLHTDRDSCEYSVSVCLQKDILYPIIMDKESIELEVGDAVFYKGCEVEHERKIYKGKEHIQMFLHFVEEGSEYAYDCRDWIGM